MRYAVVGMVLAAMLPGQKVGERAPAFRLNDQEGAATALLPVPEGKWTVLAFFPKADTPG